MTREDGSYSNLNVIIELWKNTKIMLIIINLFFYLN